MAVDTPHPDYTAALPQWEKCRDAAGGQECIHGKGEKYLRKLKGQDRDEYDAYKGRTLFYNATARTIDGMSGLIFRRPPAFEFPADMEFLSTDVDTAGTPLLAFCEKVVEELLMMGRVGLMVDYPPMEGVRSLADEIAAGGRPYAKLYRAEAITNWSSERINNRQQLTLVVLAEVHEVQVDPYTKECEPQFRALRLVDGKYLVEIHRKVKSATNPLGAWQIEEVIVPTSGGKPLDFIPFVICGPMGIGDEVRKSPVLDLVNVNLSHYMTTADYEHGLHFTGLPTPIISGHAFADGETFELGSTSVRAFPNPDATASFMEFTGQGLQALSKRLEEKEAMMASLGARMLAAEKRAAEAAETAAIHRAGENSVLASLANAASAALTRFMTWCVQWSGGTGETKAQLNTDYLPTGMSAQDITALVQAWQCGAISHLTLLDNLQRGEVARQGVSAEDELAEIESEGPKLGAMGDQTPPTGAARKPAPAAA